MKRLILTVVGALCMIAFGGQPVGAQPADDAQIRLINGLPDTEVDIEIDGQEVATAFAFRDTLDLSSFAGRTLPTFDVTQAGTDESLLASGDITLPSGLDTSVLLHLKVDGSVGLSVFENDVSRVAAGQSRLIIRHLAAAPPVDVLAAGEPVFTGLANGEERMADLPAGEVDGATLVPTGDDGPVLIGPADLPLAEGDLLIVYGVGSLQSGTMAVLTESMSGLGTPPSAVNTGNSPVSGDLGTWLPVLVAVCALGALAFGFGQIAPRARLRSGHSASGERTTRR